MAKQKATGRRFSTGKAAKAPADEPAEEVQQEAAAPADPDSAIAQAVTERARRGPMRLVDGRYRVAAPVKYLGRGASEVRTAAIGEVVADLPEDDVAPLLQSGAIEHCYE